MHLTLDVVGATMFNTKLNTSQADAAEIGGKNDSATKSPIAEAVNAVGSVGIGKPKEVSRIAAW